MNLEFGAMLSGGHPNSLGRTLEVVEIVLAKPGKVGRTLPLLLQRGRGRAAQDI